MLQYLQVQQIQQIQQILDWGATVFAVFAPSLKANTRYLLQYLLISTPFWGNSICSSHAASKPHAADTPDPLAPPPAPWPPPPPTATRRRRHASAWAARLLLPPRAPTSCPAMCPASAPNNSNSGHNRRAERAQAVAVECMAPEWPEPTSDFAPHTARALSQDTAATGLQAQASAARTEVQHMSTRRAGGRAGGGGSA